MLHEHLRTSRRGPGQQPAAASEGPFVVGTQKFAKFLVGVMSIIVLAFTLGLAWGALRAGVVIAERWLVP